MLCVFFVFARGKSEPGRAETKLLSGSPGRKTLCQGAPGRPDLDTKFDDSVGAAFPNLPAYNPM